MDYVSYRDNECGLRTVQRERVSHDCNIIKFINMTFLLVTRGTVMEAGTEICWYLIRGSVGSRTPDHVTNQRSNWSNFEHVKG
jgi:hypothetical protein